ncbi:hypothetical protein APQ14_19695 [Vibrio toranzoniae]|uniref:Uncharacterized protein n=1 Tax=Vibrio toranzoniae TaxID=1194427 RepID=A0A109D4D8_9VIBR|nr:hypothetical protein [Vibrio toranzoniae]KWT98703.1 hypothetical protein APQ14_19695 [Vibrio toranzoniae]SBS38258.1 hypothetical protein VTO7225_02976 [Vibrio toranzoniae]
MDFIITVLGSSVAVSALAFLSKNLIITRLTNAVKHEYDQKLEEVKASLKAENDKLVAELTYLSDSKLQRSAEARKIKQDYYHMFLNAVSTKFSYLNDMESEKAVRANQKFCIEFNRLPLYASQEVVEFVNNFAAGGKAPNFAELYDLIRKDLCSDEYESFKNLTKFNFQVPNKIIS